MQRNFRQLDTVSLLVSPQVEYGYILQLHPNGQTAIIETVNAGQKQHSLEDLVWYDTGKGFDSEFTE